MADQEKAFDLSLIWYQNFHFYFLYLSHDIKIGKRDL